MSLPSTSYARQSVTAGGNLTDFTLIIDLSDMPAAWWALVGSETDGTKGRAAKDDLTELATDWISFNPTADTGWLRVKWSGTLSGSTANTLRIYPPVSANVSVAASATYGSDNAYDPSWEMYLPLDEAVNNDADGYVDRTSNANHGTGDSMALTAPAGQVGVAQDFDGSADRITVADDNSLSFGDSFSDTPFSLSAWVYYVGTGGNGSSAPIVNKYDSNNSPFNGEWSLVINSSDKINFQCLDNSPIKRIRVRSIDTISKNTWHHLGVSYNGGGADTDIILYLDGVAVADTDSGGGGGYVAMHNLTTSVNIGGALYAATPPDFSGFIDGLIDDVQIHSSELSAARFSEEFDQTDDNATYWGTWEFVVAGGPFPHFIRRSNALSGGFAA